MAKSNLFKTDIAFKKLATGKVHTRPDFSEFNEGQNTFTQLSSNTVFGETIPTSGLPTTYGESDSNKIVQFVSFSIEELSGTDFDANDFEDSADSNVEAQSVGIHAFFIKLLPDYVAKTNGASVTHDRVGQDAFTNSGIITSSLRTQLVPSSFGTDFQLSLKKADGTAVSLATDAQDLYIDFATGIILRQDVPSSANTPVQGTGYLYVGKFADETSSTFSLSGSGVLSSSEQIASEISGAIDDATGSFLLNTTDEFTGLLTLTGDLSASGNISGSSLHITTTESIKNIIRSDGGWRFVSTLGTSDEDVQYLDATNNLLQWRSNGDAKFQIKSQNVGFDQAYVHFKHVSGDVGNFSVGTSLEDGSFIISRASDLSSNKFFIITGSNGFIGINEPNPTERLSVSGSISASGNIFANTASFLNIILDHRGVVEPTLTFESDGGPNFAFGFSGDNVLQLSGETGATGQVFELASEVETFRMKLGGTVLIQRGDDVGTGSKHDGGLFIESQNTTNSNGKAAQFTALNTGGVLKNTSFGGTGTHGTFKFINGGNLNNNIDSTEHVVAEFGPTSSAHFTFHVPITASGAISASGDIIGANISGSGLFISGAGGITVRGNKSTSGSIKFFDNDTSASIKLAIKNSIHADLVSAGNSELSGIFAGRGNEGEEHGYLGWSNVTGGSQQYF